MTDDYFWPEDISIFLNIIRKLDFNKITPDLLHSLIADCDYYAQKCSYSMAEEKSALLNQRSKLSQLQAKLYPTKVIDIKSREEFP